MLWMLFLPSASLFLLLLPCFPAQDGRGKEQSTDVISAWEGDSISITCPMNRAEYQLGMYLRLIRQSVNVIYCSKENSSRINPDFANRIECSKEGENFRITLHRLRESDSEIYICTDILQMKEIYRKTIIVLVKAKSRRPLEQTPLHANPEQGQSVNITCELKSEEKFYLFRTHVQPGTVLSVPNLRGSGVSPAFENRLEYSREGNRIVVILHKLQEKDSDNYICAQEVKGSPLFSARGTMVLVKDAEVKQACEKSSWDLYALLIVMAVLFCALVCCALYRVDVKKYFQRKKPNEVYEDMSYNSRRSTLVRTSTYSQVNKLLPAGTIPSQAALRDALTT